MMTKHVRKGRTGWSGVILIALATMGSDGTCTGLTGPTTSGSPSSQVFYAPSVGGQRVDWCLHWGNQCGEPAASAFCQRVGYNHASAWTIAQNIGAQTPTLVLGDGAVCGTPGCNGFNTITCARGDSGAQGAPPAGATFTYEPNTNRAGMDHKKVVLNQADPKHCKNLCRNDPACRAYTYVPPGVQMPGNAVCWLKNGVPAPTAAAGFVSGVKQ